MNVLVTGATGFVGRATCSSSRSETDGHDVIAFVRTPDKARDLEAAGDDVGCRRHA